MKPFVTTSVGDLLVSATLQEQFYKLGVRQHQQGCAEKHGLSQDAELVLKIANLIEACTLELGPDLTSVVEYYLAEYHDKALTHPQDWGLCTLVPGYEDNITHLDRYSSGLNADLLRLLRLQQL